MKRKLAKHVLNHLAFLLPQNMTFEGRNNMLMLLAFGFRVQAAIFRFMAKTFLISTWNYSSRILSFMHNFFSWQIQRWHSEVEESQHWADGSRHSVPLGAGKRQPRSRGDVRRRQSMCLKFIIWIFFNLTCFVRSLSVWEARRSAWRTSHTSSWTK